MSSRVRFGTFEFDTASGELRRDGALVRLQAQPAKLLSMLVLKAGEVVAREALRDAIWGATFVDFDKGLNFAVGQVRSALGDSAESPRYVRTIPKRGYQFIAPIDRVDAHDGKPASAPAAAAAARRIRRRAMLGWAAAAATTAAVGVAWRATRPAPTIAIVPFDNETGLPELDRVAQAMTDALVARLTTTADGRYGVIGNAAVLREARERRDLLLIARTLHAGYVVIGQLQRTSTGIRVLAHLIRLPEQTHLWVTRIERPLDDGDLPADAADRITADFLKRL